MPGPTIDRPDASEYAPFYAPYIAKVPEGDILEILERQRQESLTLLRGIPEAKAGTRYAAGKWSIREVIGHLIDSERVFAYRALRFARGDATPLPKFDEIDYVRQGRFDERALADLASELDTVRRATIDLFRHLDADAFRRRGVANSVEVSVRALACIIAGHERHHVEILRTRYL